MDDIFPILLFVIFFLVPLLEGLKKKNKQPPKPPAQRRVPPPTTPSRTEEISTRPREQESAAGMVPDDLWEILTGQKRPPVLTTPQPAPAENRRPSWDVVYDPELDQEEEAVEAERESVALEDVDVEQRRTRREPVSLETLERHPEPIIISLEDNIPTVAERHAAFHKRVTSVPIVDKPRFRQRIELRNRSELQRAMLMMEVLGPPKGLE